MKLRTYLVILTVIVALWLVFFEGVGESLQTTDWLFDKDQVYMEYRQVKYGIGPYDSSFS